MRLKLRDPVIALALLTLAAPGLAPAQAPAAPFAKFAEAVAMVNAEGVMLIESEYGVENTRFLKLGEEYRDGWMLETAGARSAVLKKGAETRAVPYGARMQLAAPAAAPEVTAVAAAPLSNATAGGRRNTPAPRAEIDAAVQTRDVGKVYALGGSAGDVASSVAAFWPAAKALMDEGGQAAFVDVNGKVGVRITAGGRSTVIVPPRLTGQAPPAGVEFVPSGGPIGQIVQGR